MALEIVVLWHEQLDLLQFIVTQRAEAVWLLPLELFQITDEFIRMDNSAIGPHRARGEHGEFLKTLMPKQLTREQW